MNAASNNDGVQWACYSHLRTGCSSSASVGQGCCTRYESTVLGGEYGVGVCTCRRRFACGRSCGTHFLFNRTQRRQGSPSHADLALWHSRHAHRLAFLLLVSSGTATGSSAPIPSL